MKKLSIILLGVFYLGLVNLSAQSEKKTIATNSIEQNNEVAKCAKTAKECKSTCENKKTKSCCQSKKLNSTCDKSKKGSFNFTKSNNYNKKGKSSCCKSKKAAAKATEEIIESKEDDDEIKASKNEK